jgi:hypothetical protein
LKGPVSKTGVGASLPWVRIPPPPLRIEHVSASPFARVAGTGTYLGDVKLIIRLAIEDEMNLPERP